MHAKLHLKKTCKTVRLQKVNRVIVRDNCITIYPFLLYISVASSDQYRPTTCSANISVLVGFLYNKLTCNISISHILTYILILYTDSYYTYLI